MTKKCNSEHLKYLENGYEKLICSRSKGHHGNHTTLYIHSNGQQYWEKWYNFEKHCGQTIGGYAEFRCDKYRGHKGWHKVWINHAKQHIQFKILQ